MTKILNQIQKQAKSVDCTILLPEADVDERVVKACEILIKKKLSKVAVLGKKENFNSPLKENCTFFDIEDENLQNKFAASLYELRKEKGLTLEKAQELVKTPQYFSMMLLKQNMVDGVVAGAKWTTADVLRPALQIIKTKPNKSICVGSMLMIKNGVEPLVFSDISLNINPTSEQLAEIAIASAEFAEKISIEPKVAMLSYSTNGSGAGEMVDKVRTATEIAKSKSNFKIEGEMQSDVALNKVVAASKKCVNDVAGKANVLVFPDINAGNISYKIVANLANYLAIGPIILNFNKPVNDLSRGCTVEEIVYTTCITKLLI